MVRPQHSSHLQVLHTSALARYCDDFRGSAGGVIDSDNLSFGHGYAIQVAAGRLGTCLTPPMHQRSQQLPCLGFLTCEAKYQVKVHEPRGG